MNFEMFGKERLSALGSEINRLCVDIGKDSENRVTDGIMSRIVKLDKDESYAYDFLKNEGYNIAYEDFTSFMALIREFVEANTELFAKKDVEAELSELSDDDLSEVAGGIPKWLKWTLVGIGAAIVVAAVAVSIVATCGASAAALGATFATAVVGGATAGGIIGGGLVAAGLLAE